MVQLLMAATLVISRLASPVFPRPSSHLADSRIHLKTTEHRLIAARDSRRLIRGETHKPTPYVNSNDGVKSSCDQLSLSPVSDEVDHSS